MEQQKTTWRIIVYLVLVFSISTVLYVLIHRGGGLDANQAYLVFLMWTPAIAGLMTTLIFQRNLRGMGWKLGKPIYYLIAFLLPIIYAGLAYGVIWLSGAGDLDIRLLGVHPARRLLTILTFGVMGAALLALGEEIGWRGVLVPQLAKRHTFVQVALMSGLIWGVWHIPLIVGGGYSSGAPTWYAITCFMLDIVGVSFAFAWLRLRSGSIWPAVLLHATHNTVIQSVLDKVTVDSGRTEYFATEFGLGLAIMGVIIAIIFGKIGLPQEKLDQPMATD